MKKKCINSIIILILILFHITCYSATRTWNGEGANNNWSTAANWVGGVAPVAGDALVFSGSTRTSPVNDFTNGTSFESITFSDGASSFNLSGNSIILTGGASAISAQNASNTMTIANNITFSTAAPTITSTSGGTLHISGTINNGAFLITVSADGTNTFSGVISGSGGVTKTGSGTIIFSAANTYTGATTISAGTLQLGASGVIPDASALRIDGIFDMNGFSETVGSITNTTAGIGTIDNVSGGGTPMLTIGGNNTSTEFSGVIQNSTGTISITKIGSGRLLIRGQQAYGGSTTISAGTLALGGGGAPTTITQLPVGTNVFIDTGAYLEVNGRSGFASNNEIIGSLTGSGSVITTNGGTIAKLTIDNSSDCEFSGQIIGNAGNNLYLNIIKSNTGTLTLSGSNLSKGTYTISAGILKLGATNTLSNTCAVTINGTLDMNGYNNEVGSIAGNGTIDNITGGGTPTLTCGGNNTSTTFSGIIQNTSGTLSLTKNGSGTLTLTGANTYTGATTVSAGFLKLQSVAFSTTARSYSILSGAVFNIDGNTGVAYGSTTISGTGTLRVTGGTFANEAPNTPNYGGGSITMSMGAGGLIDIQSGATVINGGWQCIDWSSNLASLNVDGTFNLWDGNTVYVDALTGAGSVTKGAGSIIGLNVGVNNGSGTFSGTISSLIAITKEGSGT